MTHNPAPPSLNATQAGHILRFLERATLQGNEAPAFLELCGVLATLAHPAERIAETPAALSPGED